MSLAQYIWEDIERRKIINKVFNRVHASSALALRMPADNSFVAVKKRIPASLNAVITTASQTEKDEYKEWKKLCRQE
ncbi:unnamed protein product [Ceratitis capitata]|uniref:(Mediterranean fruit fly) hypothetical protein n=1 Tax=Ceratitis capitata TaxID=7213 RepID=A0A811UPH2_CERCA|nr:unnamed protein product [Ceratitis capitata]